MVTAERRAADRAARRRLRLQLRAHLLSQKTRLRSDKALIERVEGVCRACCLGCAIAERRLGFPERLLQRPHLFDVCAQAVFAAHRILMRLRGVIFCLACLHEQIDVRIQSEGLFQLGELPVERVARLRLLLEIGSRLRRALFGL